MPQSRKGFCTFVLSPSRADKNSSASWSQVMLCDHHGERKQSHLSLFLISESHSLPSSGTQRCKPDCKAFQFLKRDKTETSCRNSFTAFIKTCVPQKPLPSGQPHARTGRTKNLNRSDGTRSQTSAGANPCFESARNQL